MPDPIFPDVRRLVGDLAAAVQARAAELDALDAAVGDGDHGTTLARGFARAVDALALEPSADPATLLSVAGRALLTMGGASGPLFATMFLEAGKAVARHVPGDRRVRAAQTVAAILLAAADGVRYRGKVNLGDKTLYDALAPAAEEATRSAAQGGEDVVAVIEAAARAARAGAERTRDMTARKGRAAFLAERAVGHPDPGASAVTMLLEAAAQHCRKYGASAGAR